MDFFTSRNKIKFFSVFSTLLLTTISFPAFAEINNGDTAWILTSTALVLFMTLPGLALFYAGLVNSKNVVSVLMQHFSLACVVSVIWVVVGYSLAFSEGNAWIGGLGNVFMNSIELETPQNNSTTKMYGLIGAPASQTGRVELWRLDNLNNWSVDLSNVTLPESYDFYIQPILPILPNVNLSNISVRNQNLQAYQNCAHILCTYGLGKVH